MTRVAVHQPNYFPWPGYFYKISRVDVFVFLDDVDYQYGNATSVTNRAKIKTTNGPLLLSVPVLKGDSRLIRDMTVDYRQNWVYKHLSSTRFAYARAPDFVEVFALMERVLAPRTQRLAELNQDGVRALCEYLGLRTPFVVASAMALASREKSERILEICEHLKATRYLSGAGARRYNDEALFRHRGVALEYSDFVCPEYSQLHGGFVANLSMLDAAFNCGPSARRLLESRI
jgi:hypothetical protein